MGGGGCVFPEIFLLFLEEARMPLVLMCNWSVESRQSGFSIVSALDFDDGKFPEKNNKEASEQQRLLSRWLFWAESFEEEVLIGSVFMQVGIGKMTLKKNPKPL